MFDGCTVGKEDDGLRVGATVGWVGLFVGYVVGPLVGRRVGCGFVGSKEGAEGICVGTLLGLDVGLREDGDDVGLPLDGREVGFAVGRDVGVADGTRV